ncbi:MAG: LytR/AlgR family response regulator transcription factor [Leadbetterella sp.]
MEKKIRCLVVDDEPGAHLVLENYIRRIDRLELIGQCYNAIEAINFIQKERLDLLFLDINMPDMSGMEMLSSFKETPKTILTTAYSEFALESFEHGVVDYLLKPIPFPRFMKAINRVIKDVDIDSTSRQENTPLDIFILVDGERLKLALEDILYVQSWGNYIKVFVKNKYYLTAMTTQDFDDILPSSQFVRVHRSYVVALKAISKINTSHVQIGEIELPIGTTYRQKVNDKLKEFTSFSSKQS